MDEALNISQLEIGYPQRQGMHVKVAGPIDISISSGELICLLGPNGVGKTTLLRTLAAIQPSLKGEIVIYKKNISSYWESSSRWDYRSSRLWKIHISK